MLNFFFILFGNFQAKVVGKTSYAGSFSGYDEYVPMVDKAVDSSWKKQPSLRSPAAKGLQVCYCIYCLVNNLFDLSLGFVCL